MVLVGLSPRQRSAGDCAPEARARGAVYGLDKAAVDAPTELTFHADTLHLDADRLGRHDGHLSRRLRAP